jgi:hypothetical protein
MRKEKELGSISFSAGAHEHPQCMTIVHVRTVPAFRLIQ